MSKQRSQFNRYNIANDNVVESIGLHLKGHLFNKLWIYPASGLTAAASGNGSILTVNSATVYIGERGDGPDVCVDILQPGDLPIKIELPQGEEKLIEDVLIYGTNGDGVWFKWWRA